MSSGLRWTLSDCKGCDTEFLRRYPASYDWQRANNRAILFNVQEPTKLDRTPALVGRDEIVDRICTTWLTGGDHTTWISGVGGIGKSALARHCFNSATNALRLRINAASNTALDDGRLLVSALADQMRDSGYQLGHFSTALTQFEAMLERLTKDNADAVPRFARLIQIGTRVTANYATAGLAGDATDAVLEPLMDRASQSWLQIRSAHRFRSADNERSLLDNPLKLLTDSLVTDLSQAKDRRKLDFVLLWCDTYECAANALDEYLLRFFIPSCKRAQLPLQLLISGRHPPIAYDHEWMDLSNGELEVIELGELNRDGVRELIRIRCSREDLDTDEFDRIYGCIGGIPMQLERWRLAGMPDLTSAQATGDSFFDRSVQWLKQHEKEALKALSVASWLDKQIGNVLTSPHGERLFDQLAGDETLFDRTEARGYRLRDPLRAAALGLLSEHPDKLNESARRYLDEMNGRFARVFSDAESPNGRNSSSDERLALLRAIAELHTIGADLPRLRDVMLSSILTTAYLFPRELHRLSFDSHNEAETLRIVLIQTLVSPTRSGINSLEGLIRRIDGPGRFYGLLLVGASWRRIGVLSNSARAIASALDQRRTKHSLLESGLTNMHKGHFRLADQAFEDSLGLDFGFAPAWACKGELQRQCNRWEQAAYELSMAAMSADTPDYVFAELADSLRELGRLDDALNAALTAVTLNPSDSWNLAILGQIYEAQGRFHDKARVHDEARKACDDDYARACVEALLGDLNQALVLLQKSILDGVQTPSWARYDPDWRAVRKDPRFREIVARGKGKRPTADRESKTHDE